jgi:hypothetical protein
MIGDKPSVSIVDERTRREAYTKMFANGAPARVETLGTVALGGMILASEVATLPDGKVADEMSVYRIENGSIARDWFVSPGAIGRVAQSTDGKSASAGRRCSHPFLCRAELR